MYGSTGFVVKLRNQFKVGLDCLILEFTNRCCSIFAIMELGGDLLANLLLVERILLSDV